MKFNKIGIASEAAWVCMYRDGHFYRSQIFYTRWEARKCAKDNAFWQADGKSAYKIEKIMIIYARQNKQKLMIPFVSERPVHAAIRVVSSNGALCPVASPLNSAFIIANPVSRKGNTMRCLVTRLSDGTLPVGGCPIPLAIHR